jgi:GT2 family glycosyltransferase
MLRRTAPRREPGPVFYNCGCVTARDRRKLLELGGFDTLFFPLYFEDTDLSWRAWKRGWRCLYEPASVVHHDAGGALGRSPSVQALIARNEWLFHWKNVTDHHYLAAHVALLLPRLAAEALRGDAARLRGFAAALRRLPRAIHARRAARTQAVRGDADVVAAVSSG